MGMVLKRQITAQIRELLRDNPQGLSITDIVKTGNINRNTASRYLEKLLISGQVEMRHLGMAKIFRLTERLPVSAVLSISSELVLQLDNRLRVIFTNDPFLDLLHAKSQDITGKNIEFTVIPSVFDDVFPVLSDHINAGLGGTEWRSELTLPEKGIFFCRIMPTVFNEGTKGVTILFEDITDRKRDEVRIQQSEKRLSEVNNAFLSFTSDPTGNINILTGLAGRMLQGTCALYNRIEGGLLCSLGQWNTPPDFNSCDQPEGHICNDIIMKGGNSSTIITDLLASGYADTDPNVRQFQLQTYVGIPVKIGEKFLGSLCVVYQDTYAPTLQDLEVLAFLGKAISVEDERRTAVQALRESEDRYRNLVEISPDAVILHREGGIVYVNPAAIRLLGARRSDEIIGKRLLDFILPEYRDAIRDNIRRDLGGETTPLTELQMIRIDGETVNVEGRGVKTTTEGKPAVLVTLHDITLRKKRVDALISSEQRYRQLLEQSFDAVIIHKDGKIVVANEAALAIAGASSPADLIGRSIYDFVHPDSHPLVKDRVSDMQTKVMTTLPVVREKFIRCDGGIEEADVMATCFMDNGTPAIQVVFRKASRKPAIKTKSTKNKKR